MTNFITNSDQKDLKKRLTVLIKNSDRLKFLVGFFYFSGIRELYEGMKNNPEVKLDILVGLNVDSGVYGIVEHGNQDGELSREEVAYNFFESVKKSLNTDAFDTEAFYEQVFYFVNLIKQDRLRIRKTTSPNHAKLYVFKLKESQVAKNRFITGSSNLTSSGLCTQQEFNVEIGDYGFEDAEKYFDDLWDNADKITEDDVLKHRLLEILDSETSIRRITPFEAYALVLKTYLDSYEQKEVGDSLIKLLEENNYKVYNYQLDAIKQALSIIEKNNGVIIADVVGLGKTIIACSVAKEMRKRGIVICPPGLIGNKTRNSGWKKYVEEFQLHDWEVFSLGDLKDALKFVKNVKGIEAVIIDEAHRFRNQDTEDYELLKNICRDKKVMILTATPFNNRPSDILSLLKLFINPKKSSITLDDDLQSKFIIFKSTFTKLSYISKNWNSTDNEKRKKAENYFESLFEEKFIGKEHLPKVKQRAKYLSKQIKDVIEPVTIRRNRLDLQINHRYKNEVKNLSVIKDPIEWFYKLNKKQSEFYDLILTSYFAEPDEGGRFTGAIYQPFYYEKKNTANAKTGVSNIEWLNQKNLFDFMRRLLVKRFESSFGSFKQSILNFHSITTNVLQFIEKSNNKFILDRTLMNKIYNKTDEEIENELEKYSKALLDKNYPKNYKVYEIDKFELKDEFIANIKKDLELFSEIIKKIDDLKLVESDPKAECMIKIIKERVNELAKKGEPKRKVVIFSEYHDTIKYLEPILKKEFGSRMLTVMGNLNAKIMTEINENFDASYQPQINDFDILLTTDKLSEGYNLNRAGMIVNFDIPWNPVRVIQRVGRINRISKKVFEELFIVNFFPSEKGSSHVKSREIARNKMFLIHNALGEDAKIFDIDEEPTPSGLYEKLLKNPDKLEEESFYTKIVNEFDKMSKDHPEIIDSLRTMPPRVKTAKQFSEDELLVFMKKGRLFVYRHTLNSENKSEIMLSTLEEVYKSIKCESSEPRLDLSPMFWANYNAVKDFKENKKIPPNEQSLEQKAVNNLNTLIKNVKDENITPLKGFLRTLLEDIYEYGTLSDFTMRRISNFSTIESKLGETANEINELISELGEDYLIKEKANRKKFNKEIIISVENIKE